MLARLANVAEIGAADDLAHGLDRGGMHSTITDLPSGQAPGDSLKE
jgi:hypothetical protein